MSLMSATANSTRMWRVSCRPLICPSGEENELTPLLATKTEPQHSRATEEQVVLPHVGWLNAVALDFVGFLRKIVKGVPDTVRRVMLSQLVDARFAVVWIDLEKECRVDHNPTMNRHSMNLSPLHKESFPLVVQMMHSHQGDEPPTMAYELRPLFLCVAVVSERKAFKPVNPLRAAELRDAKSGQGFTKNFPVVLEVPAFDVEVFCAVIECLYLAKITLDTPGLLGTETFPVHDGVRFEQRPEQIVRDFTAVQ